MSKVEAYRKVFKVIHSCKTIMQLDTAERMAHNFEKFYGKCFLNSNLEKLLGLMRVKIKAYRE